MNKLNNKIGINIYQTFFLVIILFFSLVQPFTQLEDPDMFWHIKTGQYIIENIKIPTTDIFSYYGIEHNFSWIAHEWLSDIVFAILYNIGGYSLLRFFPTIMLLIIFSYIQKKSKDIIPNCCEKYIWYFFAFLSICSLSEVRAHMFSWLFCLITIFTLFDFYEDKNNKLFLLPIISTLWVNMHGGSSSLLFVLILFFFIFSLFNIKFLNFENKKLNKDKSIKLLSILFICIITALINPNTYKILLYPIENMQDTLMLSVIAEWHSPNFHTIDGLMIFAILAIIVLIFTITDKKISILDFLLVGAFAYLTLKSIRQVVYLAIIATPIMLKYMPQTVKLKSNKTFGNTIIILFVILFCIINMLTVSQLPIINQEMYPSATVIQKLEEINPERVLNNYDWGGYLIKESKIKPFIDGRADVYSKHTLADYTSLMYLNDGWEKILEKYDFDSIFMQTNNMFTREVSKLSNWEVYYSDPLATILIRK